MKHIEMDHSFVRQVAIISLPEGDKAIAEQGYELNQLGRSILSNENKEYVRQVWCVAAPGRDCCTASVELAKQDCLDNEREGRAAVNKVMGG
jgi:hypothetical protein